jgi:ethanolamine utilization protein EutQ (cupin superfamily)|tara:strand:+ start:447 stop:737 length:291 start_codon:yes stop_codon:yes gene_type:complete
MKDRDKQKIKEKVDKQLADCYWTKKVKEHLIGKKIIDIKWMSPKVAEEDFAWYSQPCEIYLEDGIILTPSRDDEGNDGGAILTNLVDLPTIPVFRD